MIVMINNENITIVNDPSNNDGDTKYSNDNVMFMLVIIAIMIRVVVLILWVILLQIVFHLCILLSL